VFNVEDRILVENLFLKFKRHDAKIMCLCEEYCVRMTDTGVELYSRAAASDRER